MTKSILVLTICSLFASSCSSDKESNVIHHKIEIGEYAFQFPQDFKLIKEKGIDSYVGKISN